MEHLSLPVLDAQETRVVGAETLEVERLDDGGFRLLHSPAFVWGIAAGDVIELHGDDLAGFRVRARARNVAVVLVVPDAAGRETALVQRLIEDVASFDGRCEGGPARALVFTIPAEAGLRRISTLFDRFCESLEGTSWWYGNVLDRNDQRLAWCRTLP